MKKVLILSVFLSFSVSAEPSKWEIAHKLHKELLSKFKLIEQSEDDKPVFWTGYEKQFSGDCDDYALAVVNRVKDLGWKPWLVLGYDRKSGVRHLMGCYESRFKKLVCLDNTHKFPLRWREVKKKYKNVKKYESWK